MIICGLFFNSMVFLVFSLFHTIFLDRYQSFQKMNFTAKVVYVHVYMSCVSDVNVNILHGKCIHVYLRPTSHV